MPRYISKEGEWYPAKEHAVLPHLAGTDKEVYDGPEIGFEQIGLASFSTACEGKRDGKE